MHFLPSRERGPTRPRALLPRAGMSAFVRAVLGVAAAGGLLTALAMGEAVAAPGAATAPAAATMPRAAAASGSAAAPATSAPATAALTLADCRLEAPGGGGSQAARCGTLQVPENPAEPAGRRIGLRVAVVPALDRRERRPPLFVVAGGPGQAASDFYASTAGWFAPVANTRDIVLVDQRGTGGSNRLDCDFPDDVDAAAPDPQELRRLSRACLAQLAGRPEFYTTSIAVRDLDAVRAALGYERIDLYGVSYGTRVVQHYVRRYRAHTGAIVLDGVLPPDATLGPDTPFDAQRALDLMFARCAAEAPCAAAFPDLARRFEALRAQLAAQPPVKLSVPDPRTGAPTAVEFGVEQLAGAVRLLNYYSLTTSILPLLLHQAANGDLAPLAGQLLMLGHSLDSQLAYGMNASVSCSEDVPGFARADRVAIAKTWFGTGQIDGLAALCEGWPAGVVDTDLHAPLHSDVPALLLSGEADPVTPPAYGERAARAFADVKHVVMKGQGHGQLGVGCAPRVLAAFLAAGTARGLDVGCLASAGPAPFFVSPTGPAP